MEERDLGGHRVGYLLLRVDEYLDDGDTPLGDSGGRSGGDGEERAVERESAVVLRVAGTGRHELGPRGGEDERSGGDARVQCVAELDNVTARAACSKNARMASPMEEEGM